MVISWSQMYEYDMELLLIMMDHNKINNSFEFKSHLDIKYHEFLMIFCQIYQRYSFQFTNTQSQKTQLTLDMSYMTIWNNCHNNNNVTVYLNQLQQLLIQIITIWLITIAPIVTKVAISPKAQINTSN